MKTYRSRLIAVYAALSAGCMTASNQSTVIAESQMPSTFCIGRFLIDVPAGSKLSGGNYKYDHIVIEPVKPATYQELEREVTARELKLKSATNKRNNQSMLLESTTLQTGAKIFASWEADFSTAAIAIDGYRLIGGSLFRLKDTVGGSKQDLGMKSMQDALMRLRPRSHNEIPTEPGYCFTGGFIANPRWRNEKAMMDIDIAGHPDAFVSIWIYPLASHKQDKPLLERMGGLTQALGNLITSVRVLRKGDRQLGPYKGQEHLASAPASGGERGHAFVWETQGDGTLDTPAIKIELTTGHQDKKGNPQKTALTDKQAIKLWDDILHSFRLRPTTSDETNSKK